MGEDDERRRHNSMLLTPITVELSGPQRICVANFIEKIPNSARTADEQDLLEKVR